MANTENPTDSKPKAEEKVVRIFHPDPNVPASYEVAESDLKDWQEQGWLTKNPNA